MLGFGYNGGMSKTTIDELARMSQKEFTSIREEMNENFEAVGKRFDGVDDQFETVHKGIGEIKNLIQNEMGNLRERVEKVEETVGIN